MRRIPFILAGLFAAACGGSSGSDSSGGNTTTGPASVPSIGIASPSASFVAQLGGSNPAPQSVSILNSGTGTLAGLSTGTTVYATGQPTAWLTVSLNTTTAPATLTLTPSVGALGVGTYTATVPVTSTAAGVTNSPQSVTATMTVTPGAAAKLAFTVQPGTASANASLPAFSVAIEDAAGNVVTTSSAVVTVAIGANSAGATLAGTLAVAPVNGVAQFSAVQVSKAAAGLTIVASATGLASATSTAFTISAAASASLTLTSAGQSSVFLTSPNFATTLAVQTGQQYLIAVVNTDASYAQTEAFSLTGTFGTASAAVRLPGAMPVFTPQAGPAREVSSAPLLNLGRQPVSMATLSQMARNHMAILDANNKIFQQAGSPNAAWAAVRGPNPRNTGASAAFAATVGTVNKVYVRNSLSSGCGAVDSIGARVVAIGQHVVVLADTNTTKWTNAFRPDTSFYQTFANEYDAVTWPHLLANIGNPLVYDASLTGAGKVAVVITPTLNNLAGLTGGGTVVAFVNSCDFFPNRSVSIGNGFSNQTEAFYSFVPASNGYSVVDWEAQLRATAAHETKHIISISQRIINNSPNLEVIWLEEGLAQESSEIWERNFSQATWLGNANFLQTAACEIDLGAGAPCDLANNKPFALTASHLPFFFQYLVTESSSNGEGLGLDTPSNYGAGWAFARWATDQYANGNEGAFVKSLINEPSLTGLANLSQHTGQSVALLLTYFNIASAIFQTPTYTASDVRITIPSFNFANIDSIGQRGLTCGGTPCGIFSSNGSPSPTYPVSPINVSSGTFSHAVNAVPGTSASYFLLTATGTGVESLSLLTPGGAQLSAGSGFRVAIVRVQ